MVILHGDARLLHLEAHLAAALIGAIEGLGHMVRPLVGDHVALAVRHAVPVALLGVQTHADGPGLHLPGDAVEEVELELWQDQHGVRDAGLAHIGLGGQHDVPGVLVQGPVHRVVDDHGVAGHGQGLHVAEGVHVSGVKIGDEHHVALLHHRRSWRRRNPRRPSSCPR